MVWKASQKGVPFLGAPGNSLNKGVFGGNPGLVHPPPKKNFNNLPTPPKLAKMFVPTIKNEVVERKTVCRLPLELVAPFLEWFTMVRTQWFYNG